MDLLTTVHAAYAQGVELATNGRKLKLAGDQAPSPALREALIAHKPALVALLTAEGIGTGGDYSSELPRLYLTPPGCHGPGACTRLGWCERALAGTGCGVGQTREGAAS